MGEVCVDLKLETWLCLKSNWCILCRTGSSILLTISWKLFDSCLDSFRLVFLSIFLVNFLNVARISETSFPFITAFFISYSYSSSMSSSFFTSFSSLSTYFSRALSCSWAILASTNSSTSFLWSSGGRFEALTFGSRIFSVSASGNLFFRCEIAFWTSKSCT